MTKEESKLEKLKKDYSKIQGKHKLPSFNELNKEFQIEKIAETETDFLIREIRKMVAERIFNYLRNIETMINPSNAPMFVFSMVKTLANDDKKKLTEIYKDLARNEVELIKLDLEYSEEKEAEFIKNSFALWSKNKRKFLDIIKIIEQNWDNKSEENKKNYFG